VAFVSGLANTPDWKVALGMCDKIYCHTKFDNLLHQKNNSKAY